MGSYFWLWEDSAFGAAAVLFPPRFSQANPGYCCKRLHSRPGSRHCLSLWAEMRPAFSSTAVAVFLASCCPGQGCLVDTGVEDKLLHRGVDPGEERGTFLGALLSIADSKQKMPTPKPACMGIEPLRSTKKCGRLVISHTLPDLWAKRFICRRLSPFLAV